MSDRLGTLQAAAARLAACLQRGGRGVQIRRRLVCREYSRLWQCLSSQQHSRPPWLLIDDDTQLSAAGPCRAERS